MAAFISLSAYTLYTSSLLLTTSGLKRRFWRKAYVSTRVFHINTRSVSAFMSEWLSLI